MRSQASVTVESVVLLDQDKDGVADEMDACPDQPGYSTAEGCPDRDLDGIADGVDLCPEESGLTETFMGMPDTPENRKRFEANIPLGRYSLPRDIANAALYLASDEADLLTGVCLEVDGGRCI